MGRNFFAGIDVGTTACKVGVYDSDSRKVLKGREEYEVKHPQPSWAEQRPSDWWEAVKSSFEKIFSNYSISPEDITTVSLSAQAPVVILADEEGRPLHYALTWMDGRGADQLKRIEEKTGKKIEPNSPIPKMLWFRENKPKLWKKTSRVLDSVSFITEKLTGQLFTDTYNASLNGFGIKDGKWDEDFLSTLKLSPKLFPDIREPGKVIGNVSKKAAEEIGFSTETQVVMGCIDGIVASLGAGASKEGEAYEITGTSTVIGYISDKKPESEILDSLPGLFEGTWLTVSTMSTTGALLNWFLEKFGEPSEVKEENPDADSYDLLTQEASRVPPGADGLVALPYFSGARAPLNNMDARGALAGLSLEHGRGHIIRALLESVGFGVRRNLELARQGGLTVSELHTVGGGGKSELWNQIKADITGVPVFSMKEKDASLVGAIILSSLGSGLFDSLRKATSEIVQVEKEYQPNQENRDIYDSRFSVYKQFYKSLEELFPKLRIKSESKGDEKL